MQTSPRNICLAEEAADVKAKERQYVNRMKLGPFMSMT
jgi:hypothetical protein